jgi:hypothetical protein
VEDFFAADRSPGFFPHPAGIRHRVRNTSARGVIEREGETGYGYFIETPWRDNAAPTTPAIPKKNHRMRSPWLIFCLCLYHVGAFGAMGK